MSLISSSIAVKISGTVQEKMAVLAVIQDYECLSGSREYGAKGRGVYLETVELNSQLRFFGGDESAEAVEDLEEEEIRNFVEGLTGDLYVEADGPYGVGDEPYGNIGDLKTVGLFEAMAEAAPGAAFTGLILWSDNSAYDEESRIVHQELFGALSDGRLRLRYRSWDEVLEADEEDEADDDDDFWGEDWEEDAEEELPEDEEDVWVEPENYSEADFWNTDEKEWDSDVIYDPVAKVYE